MRTRSAALLVSALGLLATGCGAPAMIAAPATPAPTAAAPTAPTAAAPPAPPAATPLAPPPAAATPAPAPATPLAPPAAASPWQRIFSATATAATIELPAALLAGRTPATVTLIGTFNAWGSGPGLPLRHQADGTWRETFARALLDVPGNSGTTELQFILDDTERVGGWMAPDGQHFGNNFVVLWPGLTAATIAERDAENRRSRSEYSSVEELANFRPLRGGRLAPDRVFRSYHPFVPSRSGAVEQARLAGVQQLLGAHQIAAVINLSDGAEVTRSPLVPPTYRSLAAQGQVLFAPTEYRVVYFGTAEAEFAAVLTQVLTFMAQHPGPYLIHCRLGTDRTGVISAIMQALAGVPWSEIVDDFVRSNQLAIEEYRAPELLTYAVTRFLGRPPQTLSTRQLAAAMRARLEQLSSATIVAQVLQRLTP